MATVLGVANLADPLDLFAQARAQQPEPGTEHPEEDYDGMAKLANNENCWGPSPVVLRAMTDAFKYANRYGYPDGGIVEAIAKHHEVKPESVILGAGSGEVLKMACEAFLLDHRKVIGADPSYDSVYRYATNSNGEVIRIGLLKDHRADIPGMIRATKKNYRDVGFVYLCNPNNPTGTIIPKQEVRKLLDSIPEDVPVVIDEAYHHFVASPEYATSVPYVHEGRLVLVTRTFSKIAALAGMRLGYGLAPKELIDRIRQFRGGGLNAIVKYGGVAALKDASYEKKVREMSIDLRERTTRALHAWGYQVIPSEANFFMVNVGRDVTAVAEEFKKKKVLVGRKFPPMNNWLRVSIGTEPEMTRFVAAFKEIFPAGGIKPDKKEDKKEKA
jgi:histidinol-phosphate aminotransferase